MMNTLFLDLAAGWDAEAHALETIHAERDENTPEQEKAEEVDLARAACLRASAATLRAALQEATP